MNMAEQKLRGSFSNFPVNPDDTELINFDVVVKIGSMALIRKEDNDIDYNIFSRLAASLKPGYILVSSGATEIGRIDYMKRNGGRELKGNLAAIKTAYSAQGQPILMEMYRQFINPKYSVRQVLVEHSHFNDERKVNHIRNLLFSAANQNAIPIVNYNDAVSDTENMHLELRDLKRKTDHVVECVDNDETAAVIARLVNARILVLLTSVDGIYADAGDPSTLIEEVVGDTYEEVEQKIDEMMANCSGASRQGANGAKAKLQFAKGPLRSGTTVIIAHARHKLSDIIKGNVKRTLLHIK
ncbi:uridylate kinase [Christensenella minuta]|uniref:Amino acid kinase family protein n=2 Tax=Christensenella minuta TaxID=626937 RepID=A0A136Q593_9FIRM|nr:uridylate kinase [Christensenella minuta]KXK65819.1 amino acid kinase family protein [Christensenella minuta]